jgi:hypothetical protein
MRLSSDERCLAGQSALTRAVRIVRHIGVVERAPELMQPTRPHRRAE